MIHATFDNGNLTSEQQKEAYTSKGPLGTVRMSIPHYHTTGKVYIW